MSHLRDRKISVDVHRWRHAAPGSPPRQDRPNSRSRRDAFVEVPCVSLEFDACRENALECDLCHRLQVVSHSHEIRVKLPDIAIRKITCSLVVDVVYDREENGLQASPGRRDNNLDLASVLWTAPSLDQSEFRHAVDRGRHVWCFYSEIV